VCVCMRVGIRVCVCSYINVLLLEALQDATLGDLCV